MIQYGRQAATTSRYRMREWSNSSSTRTKEPITKVRRPEALRGPRRHGLHQRATGAEAKVAHHTEEEGFFLEAIIPHAGKEPVRCRLQVRDRTQNT